MASKDKIKIAVTVEKDIEKVWEYWTKPEHITRWNFASEDWLCPSVKNDVQEGGKFVWRMEAEDGSVGFDFSGTYKKVEHKKQLDYKLDDERVVNVSFAEEDKKTKITQVFEPEEMSSREKQKEGWQAILNNFKKYAENKGKS